MASRPNVSKLQTLLEQHEKYKSTNDEGLDSIEVAIINSMHISPYVGNGIDSILITSIHLTLHKYIVAI